MAKDSLEGVTAVTRFTRTVAESRAEALVVYLRMREGRREGGRVSEAVKEKEEEEQESRHRQIDSDTHTQIYIHTHGHTYSKGIECLLPLSAS